jgi:hypothetical protein
MGTPLASRNDSTTLVEPSLSRTLRSNTDDTLPSPRALNISFPNWTSFVPDNTWLAVKRLSLSNGAKQD